MADNDRFVIGLVVKPKECNGCEYDWETCEVTCEHNIRKGKTRAEYEDMIAESIYKQILNEELKYSTCGIPDFVAENFKIKAKNYAKAVVDRLFGEGE